MKVIIEKTNESLEIPKDIDDVIEKAINGVIKHFCIDFDLEVSVLFTGPEGIKKINKDFRNIDSETDVLSFPQFEFETPGVLNQHVFKGVLPLGDIVLNLEKIYSQAEEYGHSQVHEAGYLTIHSMLHLLGYDHISQDDKKIMRDKEKIIVSELGI
ncbi:MAG: rRNA maturation RNase YbeY [Clostridia bacterium]|nr:rRNA maturation RNase YbeY [Clostridia bacterium]